MFQRPDVLQYLFRGIVSLWNFFSLHFRLSLPKTWSVVFLLQWKDRWCYDAKTNGNGTVPLLTEYIMYVQFAVYCSCVSACARVRLGLITNADVLSCLSRMCTSLIVVWVGGLVWLSCLRHGDVKVVHFASVQVCLRSILHTDVWTILYQAYLITCLELKRIF